MEEGGSPAISPSNKLDISLNDSPSLKQVQQELTKKLEELNNIVQISKERFLESRLESPPDTQQLEQERVLRAVEEAAVIDKLKVLSILPDWLTSLQYSIDEFLSIAKSLQPTVSSDKSSPPGQTPFDLDRHQELLQKYQKLASDKAQQFNKLIIEESNNAVDSIVDMSVTLAASSNVNKGIVSERLKLECSLLFEKGLPIYGIVDCLEDLLEEDFVQNISPEELSLEVQRQYALNELQLQEYLDSRTSGHILGHVVHRLLGVKYPRLPPPPGIDLPWVPVMALLLGLSDPEAMGNLHEALAQQEVQLVLFEDALETCIEAYRQEGPGVPLLESRDPPPTTENPPSVSAIDRLLPHALLGDKVSGAAEPTHYEKETQTGPEVLPVLSLAASLGKQALETLRLQNELTDWLMVAIVIEHLKQLSKPGLTGWVLTDFPRTFAQVALFETAISGQHVPNPDKRGDENLSKVTLHQSRIVCDPSVLYGFMQPFKTMFTSVVSVMDPEPPQEPELVDYVSLVQELYLQQRVHYCLHCNKWIPENVTALADMLLAASPTTSSPDGETSLASPQERSQGGKYEYADLNIPSKLAIGLSSLWESLETAYITSLHRVFLTSRAHDKMVEKYITTMRAQFATFLSRPDNMQEIVKNFQDRYHELPHSKFEDPEVKSEMLARVDQLQKALTEVAESRRHQAEAEFERLVCEPWLSRELGERLNVTSSMIQLELDRFIDTIALLQDYFCASLERLPPDASKSLRFDVPKALSAEITDEWAVTMVESLISVEQTESLPEPYLTHVDSMLQGAQSHVDKLSAAVRTSITRLEAEFKPKPAASRKNQVIKKTKGKKQKVEVSDITPLEDLEAARLTSLRLQLLQEWCSACESEAQLTVKRLEETCASARSQAQELLNQVRCNAFLVARTAYDAQFNADRHSAATLCEFLDMAVAAEASLESPVVFPRKTLYLQYLEAPHSFTDSSPIPRDADLYQRLKGLLNIFQRVAPDGIILCPALIYILQQAASTSEQGNFLPSGWDRLDSQAISLLVEKVVVTELADWRCFLLKLLDLPVATQRQLLRAKARLSQSDTTGRGTVSRKHFSQIHLWLEQAFEEENDAELTKDLLFDLYQNPSRELTSYLEMLVASSHDTNPALGFAKACAVYSGQIVITGFEVADNQDKEMDVLLSEVNAAVTETKVITMEAAMAVILAGRPSTEQDRVELHTTLERVFREVEEQSLTPQQRRARQRQAVANKGAPLTEEPITQVPANFLLKHPVLLDLATPAYQTFSFAELVKNMQASSEN